jgi:hypothetical protein
LAIILETSPCLGLLGSGSFGFRQARKAPAEAEPQAVAGRALAVVVQAGVAQNPDHHQAHHQAHDDRAR